MSFAIRPAEPDEFEAVGRLTVEAYAADGRIGPGDPYARLLSDAAGRSRDAILLVAEDETSGELLGTVTVVLADSPMVEMCRPGEAEVRMLAVSPPAQRRGVGAALSQACLDIARAHGCETVILSSGTWMTTAHRLYQRLGFDRTPERDWSPREGVQLLAFRRAV